MTPEKNGIDKIVDKILADAEAEAAEKIASAEREAAAILEAAKEASEKEAKKAEIIAGQEAERISARWDSEFEMERKKSLLQEKQNLVTSSYDKAAENLLCSPQKYEQTLFLFIEKAYRAFASDIENGGEQLRLLLNDRDYQNFGDAIRSFCSEKQIPILEVAGGEAIQGGILIRCGSVIRNFSLEAVMKQLRILTEAKVTEILFGES